VLDVVLALVAAAGVALLPITATQRVPAVPIAFSVFVAYAGMLAVILVPTGRKVGSGAYGWRWPPR
jgi:hypothetical protein